MKIRDNEGKTFVHYLLEEATRLNEREEATLSEEEQVNKITINEILAMLKEKLRQYKESVTKMAQGGKDEAPSRALLETKN
ncbi:MAG: hypothetical protein MI674_04920 [Cytophagales bacterium]|nr:hypothetical protein [Cytophagales bacterium]